jgi:hypothetical protein
MVGGKVIEVASKEDWAAKQSDSKNSGKPVRPVWKALVCKPWVGFFSRRAARPRADHSGFLGDVVRTVPGYWTLL